MSDSPAPCAPITTNLGNSYGALLCGVFLGFMFYGANCLQVFIYLVNYPKDRMALKVLVGVSWGTDTVHQILGTIGVWQYLVTNFGNYSFLDVTHPLLPLALVFTGIVSTIAQLFLTHRIWLLSGGVWVFPAFLIPAAVVQLVLACIYMAKGLANNTLQNIYAINRYATAVNVLSAVTDIAIAAITCTLLARERANFSKRTDATLVRLIILSVNSGLWTSVFALGAAIMALVNDQSNFEYASLQFCMSPLYCNTILSCLNARDFARNGIRKDESNSDSNFYLHSSHGGGAQRPVHLKVSVETEQTIDRDNLDGGQILRTESTTSYRGKQSLNGGFLEP